MSVLRGSSEKWRNIHPRRFFFLFYARPILICLIGFSVLQSLIKYLVWSRRVQECCGLCQLFSDRNTLFRESRRFQIYCILGEIGGGWTQERFGPSAIIYLSLDQGLKFPEDWMLWMPDYGMYRSVWKECSFYSRDLGEMQAKHQLRLQ